MTAAFREDATPEDILRAIIPHLDTLGRGQFMRRECEECHRVGIGLSLIVGALKDWRSETPPSPRSASRDREGRTKGRPKTMKKKPLTDKDGEVRELTEEEILSMHPAAELPPELAEILPKRPDPEMIDDENPEWTDEDFRRARPATEYLSPELYAILTNRKPGESGHTARRKG
jgi:hypothetical protein